MFSQERFYIRFKSILVCTIVMAILIITNQRIFAQKQSYHTLRSFQTVPHALQFDIGKLPNFRFFVGPPYVSNINITLKTIGPTTDELNIFNSSEGGFFGSDFDNLLGVAEDFNAFELDNKLDLLYFGYRLRNSFFSLHITDNVQIRGFYNKDFLQALNDVQQNSTGSVIGKQYDLAQLGIDGVHYRTFGFGYRRSVNEYVSVGAKLKYIQGLSSIQTKNNGLGLRSSPDNENFTISNNMNVLYNGLAFLGTDSLGIQDYFVGNSNGNIGFAFDIGLNLRLNDNLEFYVTAIDIGGLTMKNRVQQFSIDNNSLNLSTSNLEEFENELDDTFEDAFLSEELTDTTLRISLASQAFVGGTYRFKKFYTIGAVANPKFRDGSIDFGGSIFFSALLNNFVEIAANANFDQDNFNAGLGFVFNGGPFQLYFASDNIFSAFQLTKSDNLAISTGMNFVFGRTNLKRKKKKKKFKKPVEETLTSEDRLMDELLNGGEEDTPAEEEATVAEEEVEEPEAAAAEETEEPEEETPADEEEEPESKEVVLNGIAVDDKTNEKLTGLSIEFYRVKSDGSREVLLFHSFYNGNINLQVDKDFDHIIVINKQGYGKKEFKINRNEVKGRSMVNKQFAMSKQG